MSVFVCKGCGERNTIAEVSLVPRTFGVVPGDDGMPELDQYGDRDEAFWEGETVLGYACTNYACPNFSDWGIHIGQRGKITVTQAYEIEDIATVDEEDE